MRGKSSDISENMYPVEPKPPSKQLAHLTAIKDIEDVHKQIISGYCIKSMASDPYGHPAFAVTEGKVCANSSEFIKN